MSFYEEINKEKSEKEIIGEIKKSVSSIQAERDRIGDILNNLIQENLFTGKEIEAKILEQTHLSKNMVKSIIEEYNFNKKYNFLKDKLNIKEISKIKKYFKDKNLSEDEKEILLSGDIEELISMASKNYVECNYKHNIILNEENQQLFFECKTIVEKALGRPIKNKSEMFTLIMSDFFMSNAKPNKDS